MSGGLVSESRARLHPKVALLEHTKLSLPSPSLPFNPIASHPLPILFLLLPRSSPTHHRDMKAETVPSGGEDEHLGMSQTGGGDSVPRSLLSVSERSGATLASAVQHNTNRQRLTIKPYRAPLTLARHPGNLLPDETPPTQGLAFLRFFLTVYRDYQ